MDIFDFNLKKDFQSWLENNLDHAGIWLCFYKDQRLSIRPEEALDVALCYGWIDGQIRKIDDIRYIKYFAKRRKNSIWSEKNKKAVIRLIQSNQMTSRGQKAIDEAKNNGRWDMIYQVVPQLNLSDFEEIIKPHPNAYENFINMSNSVKKIYASHYMSAKRDETKAKRLAEIIERLNENLKPM